MVRRRTATHDEWMAVIAILRAQRNARKIQHGEHVGVNELADEREADSVEFTGGATRFKSKERNARAAHQGFGVGIDGEGALAEEAVITIDDVVESLEANVGVA